MIEIITLFLGLYHGVQAVELEVAASPRGDKVAVVELWLDGEAAGTLSGPPWRLAVDLGPWLAPHELIAVARDAEGRELDRARRWVNRGALRPIESAWEKPGVSPSPRTGSWKGGDGPESQVVDLGFWGAATAVVLSLALGARLLPAEEMRDWFLAGGEPLEVLRVEHGPAEVVIVKDPAVEPYLDRIAGFLRRCRLPAAGFGDDVSVRFISPRAAPVSRVARGTDVFNFTGEIASDDHGLLWHSAVVRPLEFRARVSDAVAMAGLEAHAGRRRRAVVLMMAREAMGPSRYPPPAARDFLKDLQVPLYVWDFGIVDRGSTRGAPAAGKWERARDLAHGRVLDLEETCAWIGRVQSALREVREGLRRQRVVWLEGAHLPNRVELSGPARIRLAGTPAAGTPRLGEGAG